MEGDSRSPELPREGPHPYNAVLTSIQDPVLDRQLSVVEQWVRLKRWDSMLT